MMRGIFNGYGFGCNTTGSGLIIVSVLIIGLVGLAVFFAARRGEKTILGDQREDPHRILKARYAKGEISRAEYQFMKSELD